MEQVRLVAVFMVVLTVVGTLAGLALRSPARPAAGAAGTRRAVSDSGTRGLGPTTE